MATVRQILTAELRRQPVRKTSRATKLHASTLSRIAHGERQLSGRAIDVLAKYFGYKLVRVRPAAARKKRPHSVAAS